MAYTHDWYVFPKSIEHEYKYKGKYGAKGEKRAKREKLTPEQIRRQNMTNRIIHYRRMIKLNFGKGDLWLCFKYPAGYRPTVEEVKDDFKKVRDAIRAKYRKAGEEFRYIYRMEVGAKGGIHIHMVANRIENAETLINTEWEKVLRKRELSRTEGLVDFKYIYDSGGYHDLAKYICKDYEKDSEEYEQLSMFTKCEVKSLIMVQPSRNLKKPEKQTKECKHWTMRKMIMEGPKPTKGYYIDKDSIIQGINPFTGMSYLRYTEIKDPYYKPPEGEFL